jgi:hypothetical protein
MSSEVCRSYAASGEGMAPSPRFNGYDLTTRSDGRRPKSAIERAARHDHVDQRMVVERRSPRMKNAENADLSAQMLGTGR